MKAREMMLQARCDSKGFRIAHKPNTSGLDPTRSGSLGPGSRIQRTLFGLGKFFGGLRVTDEQYRLGIREGDSRPSPGSLSSFSWQAVPMPYRWPDSFLIESARNMRVIYRMT